MEYRVGERAAPASTVSEARQSTASIKMRIAVVVATLGRPAEVSQLLDLLGRQTLPPSAIILSVASEHDLPAELPPEVEVIMGPKSLTAQRNRGMELVLGRSDLVAFFDDDFLPAKTALAGMAACFSEAPDIAGATGWVLADGIKSGGITHGRALSLLSAFDERPPARTKIEHERFGAYGCNMVFRTCLIGDARFDEKLPLYGWQEDIDFSAQMRKRGRTVKTNAFAGVHLGVTGARSPGLRLGFSQIVNPVYLVKKGTMDAPKAANLMLRNLAANHLKMWRPEPWVDRAGRVRGNWLGILHLVSGNCDPGKVLHMNNSGREAGGMPNAQNPIIVNGRFLSVRQTGVQRVAREMLVALTEILREQPELLGGRRVLLAVPREVHDASLPPPIEPVSVGRLAGQFWEQISLPLFARRGLLVSLCNLSSFVTPGILMIHDAQVHLAPESYSWAFRNFYRLAQPLMARRAKRVLTVSNYSRDMLIRHGVAPAEKITVIHNGVDHILKVPGDPNALEGLGLAAGGYVLAISSTQEHKNIGVLLRAFAEPALAGAMLVLAGAAKAADFRALGIPCPENARFLGKVSDTALRSLMEGAACLAFPSTTEGFGLPPMEAMILGCPAVVAPCGALPEVCGDAAIYVEPGDVQGWAAALARLLKAPETRADLGAPAKAHAERYTWARSAGQFAEILKEESKRSLF